MLHIIASGVFKQHLTICALEKIKSAQQVFLQTKSMYLFEILKNQEIVFSTMDEIYQQSEDFESLNNQIAQQLIDAAKQKDVVYATCGQISTQDVFRKIFEKAKQNNVKIQIDNSTSHAQSAVDFACQQNYSNDFYDYREFFASEFTTLENDFLNSDALIDKLQNVKTTCIISELDSKIVAGVVKVGLLQIYPPQHEVLFCTQENEKYNIQKIQLSQLERNKNFSNSTLVIVPKIDLLKMNNRGVFELKQILKTLRSENGCNWDKQQTHLSIKNNLIEEAYEALEAIETQNDEDMIEELGDVLMQIVFHAQIAAQQQRFNLNDITSGVCEKLIRRHPHVFGESEATTTEQILENWEKIKQEEKNQKTQTQTLKSVPQTFPALMKAQKVQKRANATNKQTIEIFDKVEQTTKKLEKILKQLKNDEQNGTKNCEQSNNNFLEAMGEILFSLVDIIRLKGANAEEILNLYTKKFVCEFEKEENRQNQTK